MQVTVIGGGIGGLSAALFLARRGHSVTVFEQEVHRPTGDLRQDFFGWHRPRTPQVVQPHAMLAPVRTVLRTEAPDVYAEMLALGAREYHEFDWFAEHPPARPGDEDLVAVRTRRIVLETALHHAVAREAGVDLRFDEPVTGLVIDRDGPVPRVTGVRTAAGVVAADLVLDAAGRRSPIPGWLAEAGCRPPVVENHSVGRAYYSRWYQLDPEGPQNPGRVWDVAVTPFAINLVFPSDSGVFAVTFAVPLAEARRAALRDPAVFDAAARRFPASGPWLALEPEALGDVQVMAGLDNRWTALVDDAGPVVTGLVGIGDAITHTNPTLGQGVALTLLAAQRVADGIDGIADPHAHALAHFHWAERTLKPWFDLQVRIDGGDEELFARRGSGPGGPGQGPPPILDDLTRAQYASIPCAMQDPVVMRARAKVRHLAVAPEVAFADAEVREHLTAWLDRQQGPPRMPQFVSGEEWAELLASADAAPAVGEPEPNAAALAA
ncbi:2-polyprenyl-6-methoxyphenol hydroxylase-like FAD-dependent oxidoreductase [Allocatelliglobosispora scoriae]|uniref:2-polyprenyl-6-methoxyphenol hydroxylase-like FAD-dependent oxidoreductase n=1 Tax=Allocatelliglobosispora scoriae TaxID=643052 RepID=A0A841BZ35_9ACTN|nr:FAD-dependent oxidoreductase [Allocatelliglobosispora scoriae]MBB5872846.1 2-polyprenyl-6-methoxyphenol hydroxylase-like FAD-dependent oxidoreductase [Allocatelliglobosispora scoriae]